MDTKEFSTTTLAFIGDAVYELYVRKHVIKSGIKGADKEHRAAVRYVKAEAQAGAIKQMFDELQESEQRLVKRARNHKSATKPKNADPLEYKWATAFEALIGCMYLEGREEEMEKVIFRAIEITETDEGDSL